MVFSEGQHRLHQPQQRHDLRSSRGETDGIIDSVTDWEAEDSDGGHHGARLSRRSWGNHHLVMMISPEDVFFFWDVVINQIGYHGIASIRWDWVSEISNRCILQYSGISRVKVEHVELYKETTFPVCHSGFQISSSFDPGMSFVLNSGVNAGILFVQFVGPCTSFSIHQLLRPLVARRCRHRLQQFRNTRQPHRTSTFLAQFFSCKSSPQNRYRP